MANTKVQKLSEAGRKSWETRRENERQRKLSAAAHKAWATRRANSNA